MQRPDGFTFPGKTPLENEKKDETGKIFSPVKGERIANHVVPVDTRAGQMTSNERVKEKVDEL